MVTNVLNGFIKSHSKDSLSPQQLEQLLRSVAVIETLPAEGKEAVQSTFEQAYDATQTAS